MFAVLQITRETADVLARQHQAVLGLKRLGDAFESLSRVVTFDWTISWYRSWPFADSSSIGLSGDEWVRVPPSAAYKEAVYRVSAVEQTRHITEDSCFWRVVSRDTEDRADTPRLLLLGHPGCEESVFALLARSPGL